MTSPKGRILCTEDDADTRELLNMVLNDEGYDMVCTENTEQAIGLALTHFNLFLVDGWLPKASGVELTKALRIFGIKTPVLFYSGAASDSDKVEAPVEVLLGEVARLISEAVAD